MTDPVCVAGAFVGVDVSKRWLDVAAGCDRPVFRIDNTKDAVTALARGWLEAGSPELVVCEATGGYELTLVRALIEAGLPVAVANPYQVRAYARATGRVAMSEAP